MGMAAHRICRLDQQIRAAEDSRLLIVLLKPNLVDYWQQALK
jgi:hypothetical protein